MQVLELYPLQSVYITFSVPSYEGCVEQGLCWVRQAGTRAVDATYIDFQATPPIAMIGQSTGRCRKKKSDNE